MPKSKSRTSKPPRLPDPAKPPPLPASLTTCKAAWPESPTHPAGRCAGAVTAQGLCATHYRRWHRATTEAGKAAALASPIGPRGKERQKAVTAHLPPEVYAALERLAEARGYASLYELVQHNLVKLAQEKL